MNAERLNELVAYLLNQDSQWKLQERVVAARDAYEALSGNPSDPASQQRAATELSALERSILQSSAELTPARREAIREIGGHPWFSDGLADAFRRELNDNAATPAVAADFARRQADERQTYLNRLRTTMTALDELGLAAAEPEADQPELGFTIPRELFDNKLIGLSKELAEISRILDIFSEATTGEKKPVEVRQISTSDPSFFFGVVVPVAVAVAGSITWILNTWKQALEIKELRSKAKATGFTDEDLKIFENKVEALIETSIESRVDELLATRGDGRTNELRNGLRYAHRALLARIERGMTVEVRFLPPEPFAADDDETTEETMVREAYATLADYAKRMEFPEITDEPIIKLPRYEERKNPQRPMGGD